MKDFDPKEWHIRREGQQWTGEKFENRIYQAPEKIEFVRGGIFTNERERLTVLAMLLENLGIDKAVRLGDPADWKAAVAELDDPKDR
ncbi:MAG: hypothetical protein M3371_11120 [Acidobacteriota bacterium]|nr:hypothetical protein [Acidobacteriota bacterium]